MKTLHSSIRFLGSDLILSLLVVGCQYALTTLRLAAALEPPSLMFSLSHVRSLTSSRPPAMQVNGEAQKTAEEMYAEVVIAQRVSKLRERTDTTGRQNRTDGFIHMRCAAVAVSRYAPALLNAWNAWDKIHKSENQTPKIFPTHQPYMVFITADGGSDLEHFQVRLRHREAVSLTPSPLGAREDTARALAVAPRPELAKAPMCAQGVRGSLCWELARAPRWAPVSAAAPAWVRSGLPLVESGVEGAD